MDALGIPHWKRTLRALRSRLPELNFITLHYAYFLVTCLLSAIIFWGASTSDVHISFTDALFLTVSAMTEAGLNTINLSVLNTFQQFMLFALIMLGSSIFVSASTVHIRRRAFERKFRTELAKEEKLKGRRPSWLSFPKRSNSRIQLDETKPLDVEVDPLASAPSTDGMEKSFTHRDAIALESTVQEKPIGQDSSTDALNLSSSSTPGLPELEMESRQDRVTFSEDTRFRGMKQSNEENRPPRRVLNMYGVGARPDVLLTRLSLPRTQTRSSVATTTTTTTRASISRNDHDSFSKSSEFLGRNSNFHDLTEADRERLGGTEYRAVGFLSWVVPIYFALWQFLGCLAVGAYINNHYAKPCRENGLIPWWVGAFNAVSAFNNSGMSLLDANMVAFNGSVYILITMGLLILAGNTCYPIFLRWFVWTLHGILPSDEKWKDTKYTLRFLLDHPRRCYTHLFPAQHTWWLFLSVVVLNGIDCAAFAILNIGNKAITEFSPGLEFLNGLFQAFAVRSGGFYIVPLSSVRISLQVLYVIMMYISVYPVTITIRNSNVYEERSLGIYAGNPDGDEDDDEDDDEDGGGNNNNNDNNVTERRNRSRANRALGPFRWLNSQFFGDPYGANVRSRGGGDVGLKSQMQQTKWYFVKHQLRAQLAHDLWLLVLAVFFIMIIEGGQFEDNPAVFSVFNVIFEVVSGYGTVGISIGLPDQAYSFCGSWHTLSKLILCVVMLRGRHRGLPVAIDKAVLLPRDSLRELEEEDARIRSQSNASTTALPPV